MDEAADEKNQTPCEAADTVDVNAAPNESAPPDAQGDVQPSDDISTPPNEESAAPTPQNEASADADGSVPVSDVPEESNQALKRLDEIAATELRISKELHDLHRLYHSEFAGRLKSMQDELDRYRDVDSGRAFDGILSEIARIYNAYETLPDGVQDAKIKKGITYLLEDLKELVGEYGMTAYRSEPQTARRARFCKIANRLPTDDPQKHGVVAKSYNTGFSVGNRVVVEERVDVYVYVPNDAAPEEPTSNAAETSNET